MGLSSLCPFVMNCNYKEHKGSQRRQKYPLVPVYGIVISDCATNEHIRVFVFASYGIANTPPVTAPA
jgi:hypothetical protein